MNALLTHYINQFGFKPNSSITDTVFRLTCQISEPLKTRKYSVCLFLDMCKAFDSVSHEILLR